jgi:hypothetical protein
MPVLSSNGTHRSRLDIVLGRDQEAPRPMGETQRHGLAIRGHAASAGAWPEGAEAEEHHEMIRRLILLWANVKYWWENGTSEPRIAGCSGTERCAPIRRLPTATSPRPTATLTVNTASACASGTLHYCDVLSLRSRGLRSHMSLQAARSGAFSDPESRRPRRRRECPGVHASPAPDQLSGGDE